MDAASAWHLRLGSSRQGRAGESRTDLIRDDGHERALRQLAVTDLAPARRAHAPGLANRAGRKVILQEELVLAVLCHLVALLGVCLGACMPRQIIMIIATFEASRGGS